MFVLLRVYTCHVISYAQGQNYVVDVMMKAGLPERETFCLFLYVLRQGHLHGLYRKEVGTSTPDRAIEL